MKQPHSKVARHSKDVLPLALATLIAIIASQGCNRAETPTASSTEAQPTSFRETTPETYLRAVFARYQNAASYHDRGLVRLRYQQDGQWTNQEAPIQVWLDHDQMYVAAYDVRIWRDHQTMTCWILDPATNDFDSQVVRRSVGAGRPTPQQLLSDPVLTQRMAAGLAGPPPQLDWLFSPAPMEQLFDGSHQFRFGSTAEIDGTFCQSVIVDTDYVFWVDQRSSTIRRVELPPVEASINPGQDPQSMSLSVELEGRSFAADRDSLQISPLPSQPKDVRQFIPLPPPAPPELLGSQPPSFRLSPSAGWPLSERGSDRELTMLIAFNGDAQSRYTAQMLDRWQAKMPVELRRRCRIGLLVDPRHVSQIPGGNAIAVIPDDGQRVANLLQIESGGLAILNRNGIVSWIQPGWTVAGSEPLITIGAVIADLLSGVDVPKRMRQQWQQQVSIYRQNLGN